MTDIANTVEEKNQSNKIDSLYIIDTNLHPYEVKLLFNP